MSQATERITTAYEAAGYDVEQVHLTPTYTRLNVTDRAARTQSKVELVAEFLHHPPVDSDLGPARHRPNPLHRHRCLPHVHRPTAFVSRTPHRHSHTGQATNPTQAPSTQCCCLPPPHQEQ
ncbi:hypothetical protein JOF35_000848 [Streptomyces demainii]|uniref:Uncharacterized protein n=1 Tax=Streptomyces demainii TaxID=588122 RepID=A0ABT9KMA5_9ACTN|nr:hypothetical protein [Streptomyces demainii]